MNRCAQRQVCAHLACDKEGAPPDIPLTALPYSTSWRGAEVNIAREHVASTVNNLSARAYRIVRARISANMSHLRSKGETE